MLLSKNEENVVSEKGMRNWKKNVGNKKNKGRKRRG
jgi:hypothetical protein